MWFRRLARREAPEAAGEQPGLEDWLRAGIDCEWASDAPGAESCYRRIIEADPQHAEAHYFLARIAQWDRRHEEAIALFRRAAELQPGEAIYQLSYGNALLALRVFEEALQAFAACVALQPQCTDMQINYAAALVECERREEGRVALERLRAECPDLWHVHFNLAGIYNENGRISDSVASYRRCLELNPEHMPARANILFIMNYGPEHSQAEMFEEHRRFGERFARRYVAPLPDPAWPRRLKVGYVSPDLRGHVVCYFIEPLLASHDHEAFEIYCYHTHVDKDASTERLRRYADHWLDCEELSDEELAARIREDRIDILVDLAGHTAGSRTLMFGMKPAPVQATYLGYPNTTGVSAIDYHITDAFADPPGESDALSVERKARVPGSYFCYRPALQTPPVGPLPSASAGVITFGCCNNYPKASAPFIDAVVRVLTALPGSRFIMKARPLSVPAVADGLRERFAAAGVDPSRLDLRGWSKQYKNHLEIYNEIDIALDTFPYNGATTTCESLWMGAPVVTLAADRHAGRMGSSLLHAMGLEELIARDADQYVAIATRLAQDRNRLAELRGGLRARMQASPLRDEPAFARKVEALYREMWQRALKPQAAAQAAAAAVPAATLLEQARAAKAKGELKEADAAARGALAQEPALLEALSLLCDISFEAGSPGAAIDPLQRAIAADGSVAAFHYMLGAVFQEQGKTDDAVASLSRALELDPGLAKAHNNLGCILEGAGRLDEAMRAFREASRLDPSLAHAHYNLGNACKQAGDIPHAMQHIERALALEPAQVEWRCNLANLQYGQLQLDESIANLRGAIAMDPAFERAHVNLGAALLARGNVEEAMAAFRTAQSLKPDPATESWLLLAAHYREPEDATALAEAHRAWAARHAAGAARMTEHAARKRGPRRRLNIGYVSPDFRRHPVARFIEPVLAAHDRDAFRIFGYSSRPGDDTTAGLKAMCDFWRDIAPLPDEVIGERVRADGIDILVDLAGHTGGGRLLLFAGKPAPVQVTWLGYPDTTGVEAIDYRLTDAVADPEGTDAFYAERLVRLPGGFLCYAPDPDSPHVGTLPALESGDVTFGCFSNLAKVTPRMVGIWAQLLRARPSARLVVKSYGLSAASARAALHEQFLSHSIEAQRVTLLGGNEPVARHLARYHDVDIALDTFPYNGTTTTCEALWMGVPVITLAGSTHASQVGASLLAGPGLSRLVARSPEEYVAAALALADDLPALAALRRDMRARLRGTPLFDGKSFTLALEAAYRRMAEEAGLLAPV